MKPYFWVVLLLLMCMGCDSGPLASTQHNFQAYVRTNHCTLYEDLNTSYLRSDGSIVHLQWSAFECPGLEDMVDIDYVDGKPWRP